MKRGISRTLAAGLLFGCSLPLHTDASTQASGARSQPPTELRKYVERFVGSAATNCGLHMLAKPFETAGVAELQQSLACAVDAAKAQRSYWTFKQEQGIDSLVFEGLLGTAEGETYRFSYDSAPCGGPGCAGRFSINRCEKPTIVIDRENAARFGCK